MPAILAVEATTQAAMRVTLLATARTQQRLTELLLQWRSTLDVSGSDALTISSPEVQITLKPADETCIPMLTNVIDNAFTSAS